MLQLQQLQFKKNHLIIAAHPVEINNKIGTVIKTEEQIEKEKASRLFRTGVVIAEGHQSREALDLFLPKTGEARLSYLGETVFFMATSVDPIDTPIEDATQPVIINTEYLIAIIDESASSPY